jgi:hypothetical protein
LQQGLIIEAGERQKGKTEDERHSGEKYMEIWRKRDTKIKIREAEIDGRDRGGGGTHGER